jgi:cell pole-organizing protein PopZ
LTRDLLRPMLAEWLDAHLPAMVERMVQTEIARIVGKRM